MDFLVLVEDEFIIRLIQILVSVFNYTLLNLAIRLRPMIDLNSSAMAFYMTFHIAFMYYMYILSPLPFSEM